MSHETSAEADVNSWSSGKGDRHFAGALSEAGTEAIGSGDGIGSETAFTAQLVQVANSEFEHVSLFEFGHVFTVFSSQSTGHQILEFVQAAIDASTALSFQQRLSDLIRIKIKGKNRLDLLNCVVNGLR